MFEYPPFGFAVWYDRHTGRRWCWRERNPTEIEQRFQRAGETTPDEERDFTDGWDHLSRLHAIRSIREELRRRGRRDERAREAAQQQEAPESELDVEQDGDDP